MRRLLCLVMVVGLSFVLVACEDSGDDSDESYSSNLQNALNEAEASQTVPEETGETATEESAEATTSEEQTTTQQETTSATNPSANAGDAIDIGSISWLGDSYADARVTAKINSASTDGNTLYTDYEPYSWPRSSDGGVDAICCLFYERGGKMVGGKFDWWRVGGQSSKTLENVKGGYNGHSMPAYGSAVYTMIASVDGKQRSNIALVTWK